MRYLAILGDLKKSSISKHRKRDQQRIKASLEEINRIYRGNLAASFVISSGDSMQGLLCRGNWVGEILLDFQLALYPQRWRFGIGIGPIDTLLTPKDSNETDGPAYHQARAMIDRVEEQENKRPVLYTQYAVSCEGREHRSEGKVINSLLSLISVIQESWTERQVEIISAYRKSGGSQSSVQKQLGISQSTVSRSLQASHYREVHEAFLAIGHTLERWREGEGDD